MNRNLRVGFMLRSRAHHLFEQLRLQELPPKAERVAWINYTNLRQLADRIERGAA